MGVVRRSDEEGGLAQRRNIYFGTRHTTSVTRHTGHYVSASYGNFGNAGTICLEPSSGVSLTISKMSISDQVFKLFTGDLVKSHLWSSSRPSLLTMENPPRSQRYKPTFLPYPTTFKPIDTNKRTDTDGCTNAIDCISVPAYSKVRNSSRRDQLLLAQRRGRSERASHQQFNMV